MSYAAYKMMHWPTGVDHCAAGFVTHSPSDAAAFFTAATVGPGPEGDIDSAAAASRPRRLGPSPNLVVAAANVLEVYAVRAETAAEDGGGGTQPSSSSGAVLDGISGARLELVCYYRLHGNIESMTVLSDGAENRRATIALAFKDAKITCLEFDDAIHGLRTSSMHCFEGPEWQHLKRGRESFAWGPVIKADPLGRCGAALAYGLQMIILKAAQVGHSLVGEDEPTCALSSTAVCIESSYLIDLRALDMNHVKDFAFVHGYIEPVLVILHEQEPTWAGRILSKHHTCMISAFSISMTLKQHPVIWSAANLPHDAYQLLAVPPPISGVLVICANSIHYHSQSTSCSLDLNNFSSHPDGSPEISKSNFQVELDAAKATWLSNDIVMFSTKAGEMLLLTVVYDGRVVQRLDLMKSKASVLSSAVTSIGNSFFFLGSRLGDSLLVQFSYCASKSVLQDLTNERSADIEGDLPFSKRLKRIPSDVLQDVTSVEELSFQNIIAPNSLESAQKISYIVRDALINVGPLKDFSYGLRANADPNAMGNAKQSNYELVCCSGHGKNGSLSVLQQSIRPDLITEVELPSCRGIWTVYYKSYRGQMAEDNEYHAYLIISLENRTMVLETGDDLGEVTETVDYFVQASTIAAGNLFGRRRVIQLIYEDSTKERYDCTKASLKKEAGDSIRIVELAMHRWSGQFSRPFLFGLLNDGTLLCYHAFSYEASESNVKRVPLSPQGSADHHNASDSRLRNLRFHRVSIDITSREDIPTLGRPRITTFNNVGGYEGLFLSGTRPAWVMVCRQRLRVHPQLCDGPIEAFTVLHNVNCSHGFIYVTSQGFLKICQLPSAYNYDSYWPVQKVVRPLNQVLSSMADQESVHHMDNDVTSTDALHKTYTVDEFEVRILELEKPGGHWETKSTIPMQLFENALTVRIVTLHNTTTKENETLLAIGTAYVLGEDVAARGRVLLFSFTKSENSQNLVTEVYSKESKGAVSAVASLQGHLLIASGPKITLNKWTGAELTAVAFYDAPLHVVSLNIASFFLETSEPAAPSPGPPDPLNLSAMVLFEQQQQQNSQQAVKNFVLFGDIHKSIYFLSWKEQGSQLSLLAKDFGSLDCFATEFLIDGSTLSLVASDSDKNVQIFYYAPKMVESWKGQKLLSRAEFHVGAHITKFLRLQMLPTQGLSSEKTNRFALLFGNLDGGIGCIAPIDELTFRRLQSLQRKLVDAVPHVCGLNPRSFRQFHSNGKGHRPGPDNIIDFELLAHYEMLSLDEQLDVAQQIGTTRSQILSNFSDISLGTSFL
uniref:Cleavage/polyadenylation specificity factor A subunit C-terminal domain-containing protein n=1 Tax=Oryza rufipogon TaxID=4529 RepID=A0A0E0P6E2_ORYRU